MSYELRGFGSLAPTDNPGGPGTLTSSTSPATMGHVSGSVVSLRETIWVAAGVTVVAVLAGMYFIEEYWGRH